jgi:mannose-6-phosphate isomerase-like protein (cupin superfamily)
MTESTDARVLENRHTGERLELRRVARRGQISLEIKGTLPPRREGPPLHVHYEEVEEGRVITGTLSALLDGRLLRVGPGEIVRFPARSAHRWWNDGDETLVVEGFTKPIVDLDLYLQAAFDVLNSGPAGRPPLFYIAHVAWRHRKTQAILFAPLWIQPVLLPLIVMVGTVLGRYRGTDWPGCPDRCTEAPLASDGDD